MSDTENQAVDLFNAFATNETAENEGVYTVLEGCGDTEFLVARWQNPEFAKMFSRLWEKNKVVLKSKGKKAQDVADGIFVDTMADTILLGWKGTVSIKGVKTEYSKDAAKILLRLKEFRARVEEASKDMEKFKLVQDAEEAGN